MYEILTLDFEEFLDFKDEIDLKNFIFQNKELPL
jgi:hypothetical protein